MVNAIVKFNKKFIDFRSGYQIIQIFSGIIFVNLRVDLKHKNARERNNIL